MRLLSKQQEIKLDGKVVARGDIFIDDKGRLSLGQLYFVDDKAKSAYLKAANQPYFSPSIKWAVPSGLNRRQRRRRRL